MNKYREYKELDIVKIAEEVLASWEENSVFEKSISAREGEQTFTFYEGPPSANGTPGIHHVMARSIKDIFCRYKTQKGFQVKRKGGWDTHGLPVELQVEKQLGITKDDIGKKISIEEYNRKCREAVMKYKDEWDDLTKRIGYWVDLDNPYITFEKDYIESVWSLLKKIFDKGLLYKGYTIQPYSPAAGTGLSSHELNQPGSYRDVKDTSITAQFKLTDTEKDYVLAWTTTPWTLPANNALCVNKSIDYVKVSTFNAYTYKPINVVLAKTRMEQYFDPKNNELLLSDYSPGDKKIPYEVVDEFKGAELIGKDYEQLLPYVKLPKPAFTIIHADFVSTEDGTGVVHISKTFGSDDYKASVQNKIPGVFVSDEEGNEVPIVDKQGRFVKEITDFAGKYVKNYTGEDESDPDYRSTDTLIAIKLKEENKAFRVEKYEHSYPHCWRTDKPVLYYPLDSWFIKTTACKERLVELNKTINWKPESTGVGRFGNWLENLEDWNLSRSRFWGTPLPIWRTEDGSEVKCIGSIAELKSEIEKSIEAGFMKEQIGDDFDLHRPHVDSVILVSESGDKMLREPDLIDVWFDSGAMPYAQWHYPFEGKTEFDKHFPADFIAEGVDQTRGWFFTLHAIAGMVSDSVSFKNVMSNGFVLDKKGNKMSKRLGNAVDPFKTLKDHGPDATRWYMISNANPWDNLKFDVDGLMEVKRRFFGTLQNTYSFFALYANLDSYQGEKPSDDSFTESDRWITSKLNSLIESVDSAYNTYEPTQAARLISEFVIDDLSNWYVRLNRKRFWKGEYNDDKKAAYYTLHDCLKTVAQLSAPISPFYTDRIYQDLSMSEHSGDVHLDRFPESNRGDIDKGLEDRMNVAQTISSLIHSIRKKHKIKVRQPLTKILIPILDESEKKRIDLVSELILSETNTKFIEFVDDTSSVLVKNVKPNFRKLGKEHGPRMKEVAASISTLGTDEIRQIENGEFLNISLSDDYAFQIGADDVEISFDDIPGWSVASAKGITVALDININEELRKEGLARDVVNRIQNHRKDAGLDVQDKINITIGSGENLLAQALNQHKDYIQEETQATSLLMDSELDSGEKLEIDEFSIKLKIEVSEVL